MTIRKIKNKWWVMVNGRPQRQATDQEIKRFVVVQLINKFQTA